MFAMLPIIVAVIPIFRVRTEAQGGYSLDSNPGQVDCKFSILSPKSHFRGMRGALGSRHCPLTMSAYVLYLFSGSTTFLLLCDYKIVI